MRKDFPLLKHYFINVLNLHLAQIYHHAFWMEQIHCSPFRNIRVPYFILKGHRLFVILIPHPSLFTIVSVAHYRSLKMRSSTLEQKGCLSKCCGGLWKISVWAQSPPGWQASSIFMFLWGLKCKGKCHSDVPFIFTCLFSNRNMTNSLLLLN